MTDGNLGCFLDFEPTERPKWRSRHNGDLNEIPTVTEMVKDIVIYRARYLEIKQDESSKDLRRQVMKNLLPTYLFNIEREEDIGGKDIGSTKKILATVDQGKYLEAAHGSPKGDGEPTGASNGKCDTDSSLESFPSVEEEILKTYSQISYSTKKSFQETKNLYMGYQHLIREIKKAKQEGRLRKANSETDSELSVDEYRPVVGLVDLQSCVKYTHKILMNGVMDDKQTQPGIFSTKSRIAKFQGVSYSYPVYTEESFCEESVQTLLDKHNDMVDSICKADLSNDDKMMLSFKCASLFLFTFLTLHPFGDGNGRLARLLTSYILRTFSPFMTPIYNVFSSSAETDYVEALVECRRDLNDFPKIDAIQTARDLVPRIMRNKPTDLCAMLIESNWTMWRQFLRGLGENLQQSQWEADNEQNMKEIYMY